MNIHTYIYNQNQQNNFVYSKYNYIIWNYNTVLKLIQSKYPQHLIYYKRLILNKSRENFIKYILINEFGGVFISINLLKLFTNTDMSLIQDCIGSSNDMIFWCKSDNKELTTNIFDIDEYILHDDIFIVKNKSNSFIKHIISKINKTIIPKNEYQNKIYLGNIFLSKEFDNFYTNNLNIKITDIKKTNSKTNNKTNNKSWFNTSTKKLKLLSDTENNLYEKSVYLIELQDNFPFDLNYCKLTYPNIPELLDPEIYLDSWNFLYKSKNSMENMLIMITFKYVGWLYVLVLILFITILNFLIKKYILLCLDIDIKQASIDSETFFYPKKFKIFKELQTEWKIIREEALKIMLESPKLNISRTINDWHDSKSYVDTIKNKHGWIRSWEYDPENIQTQSKEGNYSWLNYGLYYFGDEFTENIKSCPKTMEILSKISSYINICGFSWMSGGCLLQPHTDITGLSSGSLALHLGLIVPEPTNTCRLIIKNSSGTYTYINEEEGKMLIFDATYEHYAYNQSNQDRLILYIDFKNT